MSKYEELRDMPVVTVEQIVRFREGYRISRGGQRRMLTIQYLQTLKPAHTTVEYKHD